MIHVSFCHGVLKMHIKWNRGAKRQMRCQKKKGVSKGKLGAKRQMGRRRQMGY